MKMIVGRQKYNNTLSTTTKPSRLDNFLKGNLRQNITFLKIVHFWQFSTQERPLSKRLLPSIHNHPPIQPKLNFVKRLNSQILKFSNSFILLKVFSLPKTCGTPLEHFFQNITVLALFACLTYPMVFHICSTSWNSSVKSCYGRAHHYCPKLPPKVCLVEDPLITKHFKQISSVFGQHTISMNIPPRIQKDHMLTLYVMGGREIMPASV
jgi:hypothetical protein